MQVRSKRHGLVWILCATLSMGAATGCSVLEVIDGMGAPDEPKKSKETATAEDGWAESGGNSQDKLRAYYDRQRRKKAEPDDPDNPIVSCRLRSGTQFLRRHDCDLRGGQITG
jgi:hypothetical protein